jgi:hypothetical protein
MKVIFLDIDGVLATNKEYMVNRTKFQTKHAEAKELRIPYPYNPQCVKIFNEIIENNNQIQVSDYFKSEIKKQTGFYNCGFYDEKLSFFEIFCYFTINLFLVSKFKPIPKTIRSESC